MMGSVAKRPNLAGLRSRANSSRRMLAPAVTKSTEAINMGTKSNEPKVKLTRWQCSAASSIERTKQNKFTLSLLLLRIIPLRRHIFVFGVQPPTPPFVLRGRLWLSRFWSRPLLGDLRDIRRFLVEIYIGIGNRGVDAGNGRWFLTRYVACSPYVLDKFLLEVFAKRYNGLEGIWPKYQRSFIALEPLS